LMCARSGLTRESRQQWTTASLRCVTVITSEEFLCFGSDSRMDDGITQVGCAAAEEARRLRA
jgi:hypothetical protein